VHRTDRGDGSAGAVLRHGGRAGRISLKVFNGQGARLTSRTGNVDAMVIFTNKVSHRARREAIGVAKSRNIPVYLRHSCGVCTLRRCLDCIKPKGVN
jgi:hypothetical protein